MGRNSIHFRLSLLERYLRLEAGYHREKLVPPQNGEELRKLMAWVSKDKPMHRRVHRAYWNHEFAMRSYYLDLRWMSVVSGLEALINIDRAEVKRQFCNRVQQLAFRCQVSVTDQELSAAYDLRSKLVHAQGFLFGLDTILPQSQHSDLYEKLESILRGTIRECLSNEKFGECFRDDDAVKAAFPL